MELVSEYLKRVSKDTSKTRVNKRTIHADMYKNLKCSFINDEMQIKFNQPYGRILNMRSEVNDSFTAYHVNGIYKSRYRTNYVEFEIDPTQKFYDILLSFDGQICIENNYICVLGRVESYNLNHFSETNLCSITIIAEVITYGD
ncbi:hypothetical protein [Oceanobacillus profundus]|uniref:Uncharacterized protein n=1 Tax=Oceanobacillus profundus TaxID=372463 RepID=A0A417YG95_9BACI|nr:hypothetical protein [Oceanobacillus profundus]MBR2246278.1 hypothetical protein [Bacilli bacterium]MBR3119687.1 hypothetical protein [Oceanobacillus sp.]RHW31848.1 hypothetical protein D1B32_11460 [Oceanobacillus profundus]